MRRIHLVLLLLCCVMLAGCTVWYDVTDLDTGKTYRVNQYQMNQNRYTGQVQVTTVEGWVTIPHSKVKYIGPID